MSIFAEANRKAFDDLSASYNTKPWQLALANQVATALQARKEWLGLPSSDIRLLDYACGTGAITKALLGPSLSQVRGIDLSPNMVEKYNEAARSSGLSEEQAKAVVGDLCAEGTIPDSLQSSDFFNFDLAVIGLGFHHFEHPQLALQRLGERLKASTGVLVVIDFLPFDHRKDEGFEEFEQMKHTIKHNGFTGEQMRELYQKAGFEDFDIVAIKEPSVMELHSGTVKRTLFISKGRKGSTAWQKLASWIGEMQDWAASGVSLRPDVQNWNGFAAGGETTTGGLNMVGGKQHHENEGEQHEKLPKETWNGF